MDEHHCRSDRQSSISGNVFVPRTPDIHYDADGNLTNDAAGLHLGAENRLRHEVNTNVGRSIN